jgi:hypothetical protein
VFWALVIGISAGLAGVGAGLDKYFMPKHDRVRWYDRLLGWWLSLEDSGLGTLPARIAERLASALDWLLGRGSARRFLTRTLVLSAVSTLLCAGLGRVWDYGLPAAFTEHRANPFPYVQFFALLAVANYPFNMAALLTTRAVLGKVARSGTATGVLWIVGNVALAATLAWLCAAFVVPGRHVIGLGQESLVGMLWWSLVHYPLWLLAHFQDFHSHKYLLMSASMLIPIAFFGALLLGLFLAKLALEIAKRFLQVLIEEHAPGQLPVFTALAFLASLANAVALAALQLAKHIGG